jgi:hypothetical protein
MPYFPPIDDRLVAALAATFPDVSPEGPGATDREIMFKAGQVSVVRYLAQRLEEQENGPLSVVLD